MATPTHTIKQGDTGPVLAATLTGRDGETAQDLTGATVKFNMRNSSGAVVIDHAACDVVDAMAGEVEYQWQASDTATAGSYKGELEVTFSDGTIITFPNNANFAVKIVPQLD